MDTALQDPLVGRMLDGRYLVEGRIARGGMATVYVGVDRRLERRVALKVMHAHLADDEQFTSRFIREARSAARLSHPNVVQVFDQGEDGAVVYLAMEYLRGRTLRAVLTEHGPLDAGQALAVLEPVVDALAAAHREGIVHRDVKPENVIVTDDGRVKVADFGLARAATAGTSTVGVLMGTVAYLAPELVLRGVADARGDVYAVGVLLFELVTGSQPFTGDLPVQVAYRHVHEDVPQPSDVVPDLPAALDGLVLAATARDPDERPSDGGALLDLVRTVRGELPRGDLGFLVAGRDRRSDPQRDRAGDDEDLPSWVTPARDGRPPAGRTEVVDLRPVTSPTQMLPGLAELERLRARDARDAPVDLDADGRLAHLARRRRRRGVLTLAAGLVLALVLGVAAWFLAGPGAAVAVRQVAGLSTAEATGILRGQSFQVRTQSRFDASVPRGRVLGTDPPAGRRTPRDSTVTLLVSRGPEFVAVPTVSGVPVATARDRLEDAGLTVGRTQQAFDEEVPAGRVIGSTPRPGARARSGTAVVLRVSQGPAPVEVPDLRGTGRRAATSRLSGLGLSGRVTGQAFDTSQNPVAAGAVLSQQPAPGVRLRKGGTVSLVISKGPPLVTVPDVVSRQLADAQAALQAQGFQVQVQEILGGYFNTVRRQEPAAGTRVPRGAVVTLVVV